MREARKLPPGCGPAPRRVGGRCVPSGEYRIDLYPTRAEFSVDGRLLHTFDEGLPADSMRLMVNAWYPDWLPGKEPERDGHVQVDWIQR